MAILLAGASWCAGAAGAESALSAAQKLLWGGKYAEAAEAYEKLRLAEPVKAAIGIARTLAATGKLDEAEAGLRKAIAADAKSAALEAELGQLLFARGDYPSAGAAVKQGARAG